MVAGGPFGAEAESILTPGAVHLWLARLEDWSDRGELLRLLSPEERERNDRFLLERAKRQHLVTWALARTTLSRYVRVEPRDWKFERNRNGKPEVPATVGGRRLRFNLSNTRGLVVCAVAVGMAVGVDVEWKLRRTDALAIAERWFTENEVTHLRNLADGELASEFFAVWTLKEAFTKARGSRLSRWLGEAAFEIAGDRLALRLPERPGERPAEWGLALFAPGDEHLLAVAARLETGARLSTGLYAARPGDAWEGLALRPRAASDRCA